MTTVIEYTTSQDAVKVYNDRGTQISTISEMGTLLAVSGSVRTIGERGSCSPISAPVAGWVQVGKVKAKVIEIPDDNGGSPPPVVGVRTLRRWGDPVMLKWGYDYAKVGTSNWQNISLWNAKTGWGAVSNFLWIDRPYIDYLQSLQFPQTTEAGSFTVKQKMGWLCSDKGKMYIRAGEWETAPQIGWGTTAVGANVVTIQEIKTLEVVYKPTGRKQPVEMARVKCFRKTDVNRPLNDLLAEGIVHRCYCVYKNNGFGDTPKGIIYSPMWSPLDWDFAGTLQPDAFWLPTELME